MLLLIFALTIAIAGIVAMELGQAARPREYTVWYDDVERQLLRLEPSRRIWW